MTDAAIACDLFETYLNLRANNHLDGRQISVLHFSIDLLNSDRTNPTIDGDLHRREDA